MKYYGAKQKITFGAMENRRASSFTLIALRQLMMAKSA
jgi:hypothetical protein